MRILSLRMENIKTYVDQEIIFSDGINCILGLNGGGKSTIIESIGYALFGFCKGKKNSLMVRHGQKQGTIEIKFLANDDCIYRIERVIKTKGTSKASMYDESGMMIYDKDGDINTYVKKVLHMQTSQGLDKIFSEVIAVPQGKYVQAFLNAPQVRQKEFDTLLGLDEYRKASEKMRDFRTYIERDEKAPLERKSSEIEGACSNYEIVKNEAANLDKEISEKSAFLTQISAQLFDVKNEAEKYQKIDEKIEKIKQKIVNFETKIDSENKLLLSEKNMLEKAQKSRKIVSENAEFYDQFLDNENEIKKLNEEAKEFKKTSEKSAKNDIEIGALNSKINALQESLNLLKNELKELEEDIKTRTINLNTAVKEYDSLKYELDTKKDEYNDSEDKRINELEQINKEKEDLARFFARLENLPSISETKDYASIKSNLDAKMKEIEEAKQNLVIIKAQKIEIETELKHKNNLLDLSKDGLCPIFNTKCNNTNKDIACEISTQIDELNNKLNNIIIQEVELEKTVEEEKDIFAKIINLESEMNDQENSIGEWNKLKEVVASFYKLDHISEQLDIFLNDKKASLSKKISENIDLEEKNKVKKAQLAQNENNILSIGFKNNIEKDKLNKDEISLEKKKSTYDTKDKELKLEIEKYNLLLDDKEKYKAIIDSYEELNDKLEILRKNNEEISKNKDLYIINKEESDKLDIYQDRYNVLLNDINNYKNECIILENEKKELENAFDKDKADALEVKKKELSDKETEIKTLISSKKEQLEKIKNEINKQEQMLIEKEQIDQQISKCEKLIEFINNARTIYIELPSILSKTYREGISLIATSHYKTISKDNYRIDISEDYNINLINVLNETDNTDISFLSGGEQMSVAIAVRLAMLKYLTNLDIYFLDEPTVNLDYERRSRLGEVTEEVAKKLKQLFVISHDDTFDSISQNLIKVVKKDGVSKVSEE